MLTFTKVDNKVLLLIYDPENSIGYQQLYVHINSIKHVVFYGNCDGVTRRVDCINTYPLEVEGNTLKVSSPHITEEIKQMLIDVFLGNKTTNYIVKTKTRKESFRKRN